MKRLSRTFSPLLKLLVKALIRVAVIPLPESRVQSLQRWRRGRKDSRKFKRCDYVFISHPKSGRTWVKVMISRYYERSHSDIPEGIIIGFDELRRFNAKVPKIFFTHDIFLRHYLGSPNTRKDYFDRNVILMVRKPQDVAVSLYFHWKYRMNARGKRLGNYPDDSSDISMFDFVMREKTGLPNIVRELNEWTEELAQFRSLLVLRYEDLRAEPERELARLMTFLGEAADPAIVKDAVAFASVENLRKLESENHFWRSGSRMKTPDAVNPDAYKVRKAKVGGYRDYFDDEQISRIDALIEDHLKPGFGYTLAETATKLEASAGTA